jgi:HK97 family phage major capsid protein
MGADALSIIKNNWEARATKLAELRSLDEAAAGRPYNEDETAQAAEIRSAVDAIDSRIQENLRTEIRSAEITDAMGSMLGALQRREDGETVDTRSLGARFADNEEYRNWANSGARGTSPAIDAALEFRAVTDTTTGATSGGALYRPTRLTRVGQDFLDRRTFLIDLLPSIQISTGSVEYVQDQSPLADVANKAVEVTEGSAKPQAGITLAVITEPTATIAAWANITRQVAQDAPQVQGYLDTRLRYAVKRRADAQSINGNGTLPNLRGLLNRTGIVTYAPGAAEARYVSIRHGIRLMEDNESVPEIIVVNPADAELFDLSNSTTAGIHAVPDDAGITMAVPRTMWGLTAVHSTAIAAGTALLIDPMAVSLLDRQQVSAYMTDSHASNFTSNILTLLLEARIGLALFNPKGVASITFNGTA